MQVDSAVGRLECNEMDSALSAHQAARRLGTSAPRVVRAVDRLGLDVKRGPGGRMRLRPSQMARLEAELGVVPAVDGLSPTEARVLGALARAPLGLPSARAVAERAGTSPTAASAAVDRLRERGLLREERRTVALGSAHTVRLIAVDVTHADWPRIAPRLAGFRPRGGRRRPSPEREVPASLRHLFWNVSREQLDVAAHGGFIARRLLVAGDLDGLAWGAANLSRADWEHAGRARGLEPDRRALAHNLADVSR
jgi:DNA-binding Lrp family transcriptional regulator